MKRSTTWGDTRSIEERYFEETGEVLRPAEPEIGRDESAGRVEMSQITESPVQGASWTHGVDDDGRRYYSYKGAETPYLIETEEGFAIEAEGDTSEYRFYPTPERPMALIEAIVDEREAEED